MNSVLHPSFITRGPLFSPAWFSSDDNTAHRCALFSCLSSLPVLWRYPPHHHHHHPLTPPSSSSSTSTLTLLSHPTTTPPPTGPLSLVRGLAVRPSPVSAAAVISSGPSGGLLLTSQAWDRVTSSLNMMGLNQQCVRLNRGGRETKQLRELSAS